MQLSVNIYREAQLQLRGRLMMLDGQNQLVNLWLTQVLLLRLLNINKLSVRLSPYDRRIRQLETNRQHR